MVKRIQTTVLSGFILLFFFSCQSPNQKQGKFVLIPSPQQFDIKGVSTLKYDDILNYYAESETELPVQSRMLETINSSVELSKAQIIFSIDTSMDLPAEAYKLEISKKLVFLRGKDEAGLFYAFQTLGQLMEDAKEQNVPLPLCNIEDFPLLSYRAIHLDIKHHIDKKEYYHNLIDKLAKYKVNAIIAEMEDKLKYKRQPEVGSADAFSISEWKELSDYAKERNIEISPLIQGLGHASFILKHDKYKHLRDDPKSDWAFNPLNPETYKVQYDLYLDAIEATPHGRYLHIGGDEVHTTGRGSGKSALELQLIWLNKVSAFAEEHGRTPIFWDDMPLKFANVYRPMFDTKITKREVDSIWDKNEHILLGFLDKFPKNCIYMRWNYSSPQAIGNIKAMEWFRNKDLQVMGATAGQTRWVLMPQNESNIDNIKSFAESSINNDLNGLLLTLWDDDSPHFELYTRGIVAFAEYTWAGEKRTKEEVKTAFRHREFSGTLADPEYAFIDQLEEPVAFYKNALIKGNKRNYLKKMKNPVEEAVIDLPDKYKKGEWSTKYAKRLERAFIMAENCDSVAAKIAVMKAKTVRNKYLLDVCEQVNELARFAPKALLVLKAYDEAEDQGLKTEALKQVRQLPEDFKKLRQRFEEVYSKTRNLTKPDDYILDQDHHVHLANQTISFDWQFYAEMLFLEKIENQFITNN
jgi:hypothetical protein